MLPIYVEKITPQISIFANSWSKEKQKALAKFLEYIEKFYLGESITRNKKKGFPLLCISVDKAWADAPSCSFNQQ